MSKIFNALTDMTIEVENSLNHLSDTRNAWCPRRKKLCKDCNCVPCREANKLAEAALMFHMWKDK